MIQLIDRYLYSGTYLPEGNSSVLRISSSIYFVCKLMILSKVKIMAGPIKNIQNLGLWKKNVDEKLQNLIFKLYITACKKRNIPVLFILLLRIKFGSKREKFSNTSFFRIVMYASGYTYFHFLYHCNIVYNKTY